MFTGFSEKTSAFLWELAFHNERPWFLEHKQEFEEFVNTPLKALARESFDALCRRCPDFEGSVHISRIYRDARRLFGRGPYKDHLWFSVKDSRAAGNAPVLWFELSAAEYACGMGFYEATPRQMEAFRAAVEANPARFRRLAEDAKKRGWQLGGEPYKRPKRHSGDALLDEWLNRRHVGVQRGYDLGGEAFTAALPERLAERWAELLPLFQFLTEVSLACPEQTDR